MLGVVFAQRNAYVAIRLTLMAVIQVTQAECRGVDLTCSNPNFRICPALAFPAVTHGFEGVNLRCLLDCHFWGVTLTKTLAANGGDAS